MNGEFLERLVPVEQDMASLREQIALRAYQLWQQRGSPIGSPLADWMRAEKEI